MERREDEKRLEGKLRMLYFAAFIILMAVETLIALYVHDDFIRPYVGDILVVFVVYCFARIFIPVRVRYLPVYVFIFAAGVEILQYFNLAALLGLEGNRFARIVLGTVADVKDIVCYGAGCILLEIWEWRKKI